MARTLALALFVVLAAVVGLAPRPETTASAEVTLVWAPCDGRFECATLPVPLDYGNPAGRTITIGVVRQKASDPARRIGVLLVNPGGPGASAVNLAEGLGSSLAPDVRARFDIIGFDPRGVGRSSAVVCHDNLQAFIAADPNPDTPAEWDALDRVAKEFAGGCAARAGDILPFLGTASVARDMERVRIALGEEKLNYLGFSYGTTLGAVYADLFPGRVRAMVLDGAYRYYDIPGEEGLRLQSVGFEHALDAYVADCVARNCLLAQRGDPAAAVDELLARTEVASIPSRSADRPAGRGEAGLGISYALYLQAFWPSLTFAVDTGLNGDGSALVRLADAYLGRLGDGSYPNGQEIYTAVSCLDYAWPTSLAAFQAIAPEHAAAAPHFGVQNLLQSALPCGYWPAPPQPLATPTAAGAPPILVVATTNDPATPYEQGVAVSEQLSSGFLLTHVGEGHTVYGSGNRCVDGTVNAYLLALTTFATGSRCLAGDAVLAPPPFCAPAGVGACVAPAGRALLPSLAHDSR